MRRIKKRSLDRELGYKTTREEYDRISYERGLTFLGNKRIKPRGYRVI